MVKNVRELVKNLNASEEAVKKEQQTKRAEVIEKLVALRKRVVRLVKNTEQLLSSRKEELKEINTSLCQAQGHTYSDWEMKDGFIDRTWYYTRTCQICGHIDQTENEPAEYRAKRLERKRFGQEN